jgi:mono/diheme cytochrome c family protein
MARAKPKPRTKAKPVTAVTRPPPPPPPATAEVPPVAEGRGSQRATIVAIAIAVLCACFTALLLSGWTPGPHQSAPPRIAAKIAPAAPKKAATAAKQTVKPKPKAKPTPKAKKPVKRITPAQFAAELFVGECGFCHTLSAVGAKGTVGPNLDQLKPSETRVLNAIANGGRRTGLMPPGIFSGADATRVAKFVAEATRR